MIFLFVFPEPFQRLLTLTVDAFTIHVQYLVYFFPFHLDSVMLFNTILLFFLSLHLLLVFSDAGFPLVSEDGSLPVEPVESKLESVSP